MSRVLILCGSYPDNLSSGADLRFQNLCKQIAMRHDSYLVCLGPVPDGIDPMSHIGVLGFETLPTFPKTGRSLLRHLRLTDTHLLRRSVPAYLAEMQATLGKLVVDWQIETLVCLVPPAAEMLLHIDVPKLIDYCDSRSLTIRRILENRSDEMSLSERLSSYVAYFRQRNKERSLVKRFDRTTTVADADRTCLLEVSGAHPGRVVVIGNGVSSDALGRKNRGAERKRSVVFWGNLDFPPNWTAIDYFNREIFLPHLAEHGVEWHIIGRGADESIRELATHPLIHLHGFVEDLFAEISSHGVMINPMVEGSGLKNKVLEAFACRLPVVSTTMGIEAIGTGPGEHYLVADDAHAFACAVTRCLEDEDMVARMTTAARQLVEDQFEWNAIGEQLSQLLQDITR